MVFQVYKLDIFSSTNLCHYPSVSVNGYDIKTNLKVRGHEKKLAITTYFLKSKGELPCVINPVFSTVKR